MQNATSIRKAFERHMIRSGTAATFEGCGSNDIARYETELQHNLDTVVPCKANDKGRRINNFCVGSDPEFVFVIPKERHKVSANTLGLKPGLACGADQNLRLAELRGWPTLSVSEHLAGIMASLRWMYRIYVPTRTCYWRAGAHFDGDGMGGHVHFGRKRPHRELEVQALDGLAEQFYHMGLFDVIGWEKRRAGDERGQRYGLLGDIRPQIHGYEYRALPSWLCSPLKAFVVIAASKLAVLDPELTSPWRERKCQSLQEGLQMIQRFARYYSGRDDDAWMLKHLLVQPEFYKQAEKWGTPVRDFKLNWGFKEGLELEIPAEQNKILPAVIQPAAEEILEMQEHLTSLKPLTFASVLPTFVNVLPKHYHWPYHQNIRGIQYGGAGDLVHNLVCHDDFTFIFGVAQRGTPMAVDTRLFSTFTPEVKDKFRKAFPTARIQNLMDHPWTLTFDQADLGVKRIGQVREFLFEWNALPIWKVNSVKATSLAQFKASNPGFFKAVKSKEKVL